MKILIADDSSVIRTVLRRQLGAFAPKAEIEECTDGEALVECLTDNIYDLIFVDVHMPKLKGSEAIEASQTNGKRFTVVFMSTDMSEDITEQAKKVGAFDFLIKPFNEADIGRILKSFHRVKRLTRVLLTDDSPTMRGIMTRVLERSQFNLEVKVAGSGEEAIELCRTEAFQVVLLDVNMPGIDGVQTVQEIRQLHPDTKVILVSAADRQDVFNRIGETSIDAFLGKPFMPRDIDRVLYRMFGMRVPVTIA